MIRELIHQIGRLFTWFVLVAPWEQALRVRLGRRVRLLGPGVYVSVPFFDRVYRQSVRRRLSLIYPQVVTTRDGQAVTLGASIGYKIVDLLKLYDTLHDASSTIECEAAAHIAAYVASSAYDECTPGNVEEFVRGKLGFEKFGLGEVEFYVTNFARVRTYRFITGGMREYMPSDMLQTTSPIGDVAGRPR